MTDVLCPKCAAPMFYASVNYTDRGVHHHYVCPRRCCYVGVPFSEADLAALRAEREDDRRDTARRLAEVAEQRKPLWRRLLGV